MTDKNNDIKMKVERELSLAIKNNAYEKEIREFLDNFFDSKYLQYRILADYSRICAENGDIIEKEIAEKKSREEK